ncbi:MAG TPA: plastocyanin/azurin family copper-binding protein [Chloroflexia bacterium]|jgi:uncharacterized cupredoxin-like copper-binding protein
MDFKARWAKTRTFGITAILAGALALTLAACGGETNTGGTGGAGGTGTTPAATTAATETGGGALPNTPGAGGKTNTVDVTLDEWTIVPKDLQIPPGSTTFHATNEGEFSHNFVLQKDGNEVGGTPTFSKGDSPKDVTLDLQPGTYTTICTVPGHAQQGMTGKLTVTP